MLIAYKAMATYLNHFAEDVSPNGVVDETLTNVEDKQDREETLSSTENTSLHRAIQQGCA